MSGNISGIIRLFAWTSAPLPNHRINYATVETTGNSPSNTFAFQFRKVSISIECDGKKILCKAILRQGYDDCIYV